MNAVTIAKRYVGRIATVHPDGYAFISLRTTTGKDGSLHGLQTDSDIFLHQHDSKAKLEVGTCVEFDLGPDLHRGSGKFRAMCATNGFELVVPGSGNRRAYDAFTIRVPEVRCREELALPRRWPVHLAMKDVPAATVAKVIGNAPMLRMPRPDLNSPDGRLPEEQNPHEQLQKLLIMLFPTMAAFGADYKILDHTDQELDALVETTIANYSLLGLGQQIPLLRVEIAQFKSARGALEFLHKENLVRRDSVIPMACLPDLFMAAPVWYVIAKNAVEQKNLPTYWSDLDPDFSDARNFFCGLFPNQAWQDTFQLFNRRIRPMSRYSGESIPPNIAARMVAAAKIFDYVVVMTPYHDQALNDWRALTWQRPMDPYVVGFMKDKRFPLYCVLGRYSGTGTFPLMNELIADTIEFLKAHRNQIGQLVKATQLKWQYPSRQDWDWLQNPGVHLTKHIDKLVGKFDDGQLFDWLRGDGAETKVV